jgi:hypothetical protein
VEQPAINASKNTKDVNAFINELQFIAGELRFVVAFAPDDARFAITLQTLTYAAAGAE